MPFQVACTHCGNRLNVKDDWEGKRIKCPKCGEIFPAARPPEAVQRSRVQQLADDEDPESEHGLPFRFGPDDRYPRWLYWAFLGYLLLDAGFAVPVLASRWRDPTNQCVECLVGRVAGIVIPLTIGVCIFIAYSMGALMYAGIKLAFVGVAITGAFGLHMDGQDVDTRFVVLESVWHASGIAMGLWYFLVRRE